MSKNAEIKKQFIQSIEEQFIQSIKDLIITRDWAYEHYQETKDPNFKRHYERANELLGQVSVLEKMIEKGIG